MSLLWMSSTTQSRQTFLLLLDVRKFTLQSTIAAIDQGIHRAGADHPRTSRPAGGGLTGVKGPHHGVTGFHMVVKDLM